MLYLNDIHVNCFVYFENTYFVPVCMDCFHLFLSLSQSLLVIFFSTAHRHRSSRISKHFPWFLKIAILLNISTFLSSPLAFPSSSAYQCLPWSPVFFVSMPKPLQNVKNHLEVHVSPPFLSSATLNFRHLGFQILQNSIQLLLDQTIMVSNKIRQFPIFYHEGHV